MNIQGLDYNTQRERLVLPEYGRGIQNMVDHACTIADPAERQACAEAIVATMERMFPQMKANAGYKQKLWDHLAIMSNFKLDIDWPYDVSEAKAMTEKPSPMPYPEKQQTVRHYGHLMMQLFEQLRTMPDGPELDILVRQTANQMKRDLMQWGHACSDEKVADDLARFTNGRIQLDLETFRFDKIQLFETERKRKKK